MKFFALFALAALAVAAPIDSDPEADLAPPSVTIDSIIYGGSGCPQGSLSPKIVAPFRTLALFYPDYTAKAGPDVPIAESRKNCQVGLRIKYPAGWQYTISSTLTGGHVRLDKGVTGVSKVTHYFSGSTEQGSAETVWKGPVDKDYFLTNEISSNDLAWSPCNEQEMLNVNMVVRVDCNDSNGKGTVTTDFGAISLSMGLKWRRC